MSKKIKVSELPEFDITEHLESEEAIAEYLTLVIEDKDPSELAHALGVVARARGMSQVAELAGITVRRFTRPCGLVRSRGSTPCSAYAQRWA